MSTSAQGLGSGRTSYRSRSEGEVDHGAVQRKETGRDTPKMVRVLIGNPLR